MIDRPGFLPPPVGARTVARPRIDRALDRLAAGASLVDVVAPLGAGKSTAVAAWYRRHAGAKAWLELRLWDRDPTELWGGVTAAITSSEAYVGAERLDGGAAQQGAWGLTAVRSTAARVTQPLLLVVDGVEVLEGTLLGEELREVPRLVPGLTLVRVGDGPSVADGIGPTELGLDRHERAALLAGIAPVAAASLADRLGGDVAATALAARLVALGVPVPTIVASLGGRDPLEVMVPLLLSCLSGPEGRALVAAALLAEVEPDVVEAMVGPSGPRSIDALVARGILDHDVVTGRLAVPAALRRVLVHGDGAETWHWHRKAADALVSRGRLLAAVPHLAAVGDGNGIADVLARTDFALVASGRHETIARVLAHVDGIATPDDPGHVARLVRARGMAAQFDGLPERIAAARAVAPAGDRALAVVLDNTQAMYDLICGDPMAAVAHIEQVMQLPNPTEEEHRSVVRLGALGVRALAWCDRPAEARTAYAQALRLRRHSALAGSLDDHYGRTLLSGALAHAALAEGSLPEAIELVDGIVRGARAGQPAHRMATFDVWLVRGAVARLQHRIEVAEERLGNVAAEATRHRHPVYAVRAQGELAMLYAASGRPGQAAAALAEGRRLATACPDARWGPWLDLSEGWMRLLEGRPAQVLHVLPEEPDTVNALLLRATALVRVGQVGKGLGLLGRLTSDDARHPMIATGIHLLAAQTATSPTQEEMHLRAALRISAETGLIVPFVAAPAHQRVALLAVLDEERAPRYARLVRALQAAELRPRRDGASITQREREILEQLRSGAPLSEVAVRLNISRNTLKTHLRHIYAKLGASGRTAALAILAEGANR